MCWENNDNSAEVCEDQEAILRKSNQISSCWSAKFVVTLQGWVFKTCDDVSGKNGGIRSKGDTWQLNEEVKEAVSRKKVAHKAMCQNSSEENKRRY